MGDIACGGRVSLAAGRGQVLEHGCAMSGKHLRQLNGLRLHPEEVVAQRLVRVDPLGGVQCQEAVQEVEGVGILDVVAQALLDLSLVALGQLDLVVQVQLFHSGPHLCKSEKPECTMDHARSGFCYMLFDLLNVCSCRHAPTQLLQ